jgi:hypothetical protein
MKEKKVARSTTAHPGTSRWRCAQAIAKSDIQEALAEAWGLRDEEEEFDPDKWHLTRMRVLVTDERVKQAEAMICHPSVSFRPYAPQEIQGSLQSA